MNRLRNPIGIGMSFFTILAPITGCHPTAEVAQPAPELARQTFERIKALEGTWEGPIVEVPDVPITITFETVSDGHTVIQKEIIPEAQPDPVMVTLYYMDGVQLKAAHYCAAGNQPEMVLAGDSREAEAKFGYSGGRNLDPRTDWHIHSGSIQFVSADSIVMVWDAFHEGKRVSAHTYPVKRVDGREGLGARRPSP